MHRALQCRLRCAYQLVPMCAQTDAVDICRELLHTHKHYTSFFLIHANVGQTCYAARRKLLSTIMHAIRTGVWGSGSMARCSHYCTHETVSLACNKPPLPGVLGYLGRCIGYI